MLWCVKGAGLRRLQGNLAIMPPIASEIYATERTRAEPTSHIEVPDLFVTFVPL